MAKKKNKPAEEVEEVFEEEQSDILREISEMPEGDDDLEEQDEEFDEQEEDYVLADDAKEKLDKIVEEKTEDISAPAIIRERGFKDGDYEASSDYPTANHFLNRVKATKDPSIVERTPQHNPFLILRDKK